MMKTSANGRKLIEQFEGCRLQAYQDVRGIWTIGYGHTSAAGLPNVRPGMVITQEQADAILSADLGAVENDVNQHVTVAINQNQCDALVSFDYNTGALDRSNVLRSVNSNQFSQVTADLMMWDHATEGGRLVVVAGLATRRADEGKLFDTPITETEA